MKIHATEEYPVVIAFLRENGTCSHSRRITQEQINTEFSDKSDDEIVEAIRKEVAEEWARKIRQSSPSRVDANAEGARAYNLVKNAQSKILKLGDGIALTG